MNEFDICFVGLALARCRTVFGALLVRRGALQAKALRFTLIANYHV